MFVETYFTQVLPNKIAASGLFLLKLSRTTSMKSAIYFGQAISQFQEWVGWKSRDLGGNIVPPFLDQNSNHDQVKFSFWSLRRAVKVIVHSIVNTHFTRYSIDWCIKSNSNKNNNVFILNGIISLFYFDSFWFKIRQKKQLTSPNSILCIIYLADSEEISILYKGIKKVVKSETVQSEINL